LAAGRIAVVRADEFEDVGADLPFPERSALELGVKRCIDLLGAATCLVLALPILVVAAIAIRLNSPGPVLFAHRRLGRDGRHFDCLKFRSMRVDAEHLLYEDDSLRHHYVSNNFKVPTALDPRITRLGRFLRKSSIDELPQLWNVIRGEMSLVGPRPIVALESTHYGEDLALLLSTRPGITGAWAVHGRSSVGYPARAELELEYVRRWNLWTDVEILLQTPKAVLTQRGAI
jgi:lipopolysaccharide/colanic/teichoic acid biosynthesis glycosyltransferase